MASGRPNFLFRNKTAKIAAIPMILTALFVFVGGTAWTTAGAGTAAAGAGTDEAPLSTVLKLGMKLCSELVSLATMLGPIAAVALKPRFSEPSRISCLWKPVPQP